MDRGERLPGSRPRPRDLPARRRRARQSGLRDRRTVPRRKGERKGEAVVTEPKAKKVDLRKELKHLYNPSAKEVSVVDVPEMNFLMVDGEGDPNTSEWYGQA